MKANELMVGDLIKTNSHSWNDETLKNKYCKVEMVGQNYLRCSLINNPKRQPYGEENSFEPILLTPEILEKNGFHKEWDGDIILMVCDTIIVEIGNMYKIYKDGKMYLRRVLAPLYYVHQLQHALRLCGIGKEIEL